MVSAGSSKKIKQMLDDLTETINNYEKFDSDVYIYDYFAELRNKVDLHREELVKEINERSDEIIKRLKEKQDKCKLNSNKIKKNESRKVKRYRYTKYDAKIVNFRDKPRRAK